MLRSFLPVVPDEIRRLRPETAPPRPPSMRWRLLFTGLVLAGLLGFVQLFAMMRFNTPCSEVEQEAWDSIQHHPELELQHAGPGCMMTFVTVARPVDVLGQYRSTLTAAGWTVVQWSEPVPWPAEPSPPPPEGPMPRANPAWSGSLMAMRGGLQLDVVHEVNWAEQRDYYGWELRGTVFVILTETEPER